MAYISGNEVGNITVDPNHIFSSIAARDMYFETNTEELMDGVHVWVGTGTSGNIFKYNDPVWEDIGMALRGPKETNVLSIKILSSAEISSILTACGF
jgi:hypothetical protein